MEYSIASQPAVFDQPAVALPPTTKTSSSRSAFLRDHLIVGTRLSYKSGDTLLVATDGIVEAADKPGNEYGLDRL